MAALAKDRNTPRRAGELDSIPVKAGAKIWAGSLVITDAAGWAIAGAALGVGLVVRGRSEEFADNTSGANGDIEVRVHKGTFRWANSAAGDALSQADEGKLCFLVDDQTVAKTVGVGNRPVAGRVVEVDSGGVWVRTGEPHFEPRMVRLPFAITEVDTLAGTSAELISPVTGAITSMSVIVQKDVTTGGPVTANVGATPVAGLSCVIANAATKGTVVTDTPTGDATAQVTAGGRIQVVPDPAFNTAGAISGFIEITH